MSTAKVYHTATQEDFNALMKEFGRKGYKWSSGEKPMQRSQRLSIWKYEKEDTCIRVSKNKLSFNFGDRNYYQSKGFEIIEYKAPQKEEKAMELAEVFTLKLDEQGEPVNEQTFITQSMLDIQEGYKNVLKIEKRLRKQKEYLLKNLEEAVREEHKALIENVEQLDKVLKGGSE